MTDSKVATLVTNRPDAELAAEFKKRLVEAYDPVLRLLDEINAAGFDAGVQTNKGPLGKQVIVHLVISKVF